MRVMPAAATEGAAKARPVAWTFLPFIERKCHKGALIKFCAEPSVADGTACAPIFMRIRSSLITCGAVLSVPFRRLPIHSVLPSGEDGHQSSYASHSPAA